MVRLEVRPADQRRGQEGELGTGEVANDALTGDLLPQRDGRVVPHHEIAVAEETGDAEAEHLSVDPAIERGSAVAQRAIGQREGDVAALVVDDLVGDQNPDGKEDDLTCDVEQDPLFPILEPLVRRRDVLVDRIIDRANQVAGVGSADPDAQLIQLDRPAGPVGGPGLSDNGQLEWKLHVRRISFVDHLGAAHRRRRFRRCGHGGRGCRRSAGRRSLAAVAAGIRRPAACGSHQRKGGDEEACALHGVSDAGRRALRDTTTPVPEFRHE